jgi:hypothetical protein
MKLKQFYKKALFAEIYQAAWGTHCRWVFELELLNSRR